MLKLHIRNFFRILCAPLMLPWYIRRITKLEVVHQAKEIECKFGGYVDRTFYEVDAQVTVYISARKKVVKLMLEKALGPYEFEQVELFECDVDEQSTGVDPAKNGCGWKPTFSFKLREGFGEGYYRISFLNDSELLPITFIVGDANKESDVIVLAPVTTWAAYNEWGGKSVYKNFVEKRDVYELSTQRPNDALTYNAEQNTHDIPIEINIFSWFKKEYEAKLLPDYYLESHPELFENAKVVVLAHHAEYFSKGMYENLLGLVNQKKSLIALGANQIYWKVRWHQNFKKLECRKNMTFFKGSLEMGGRWSYSTKPEGSLLGGRFTPAGMGTFAPYRVIDSGHWLFRGVSVSNGDLFGQKGINNLPICGDETDEVSMFSGKVEILARGLNVTFARQDYDEFDDGKRWDGKGGGDLLLVHKSSEHAVLNTGAIQSGSGLGTDEVFTQVIVNFLERYKC